MIPGGTNMRPITIHTTETVTTTTTTEREVTVRLARTRPRGPYLRLVETVGETVSLRDVG